MTFGSCRSVGNPDVWFPEKGQNSNLAKRICQECPVIMQCLEWALYRGEDHGVWGGKTPSELEEMRVRLGILGE